MEEITVNKNGGKQHKVSHRCEALFPRAILKVAELRAHGHDVIGYEDENYLNIPVIEHVGRAERHVLLFMAGDKEDGNPIDHLIHACCRLMMAIEEELIDEEEFDKIKRMCSEREQLMEAFGYDQYEQKEHGDDRNGAGDM